MMNCSVEKSKAAHKAWNPYRKEVFVLYLIFCATRNTACLVHLVSLELCKVAQTDFPGLFPANLRNWAGITPPACTGGSGPKSQ